jgi:hypothetical protein
MNNSCFNCETKNDWYLMSEVEVDGQTVTVCDDCREEMERIDSEADRLTALPSCDYRAMIIDRAQTSRQLVNELRAHDMNGCHGCRSLSLAEVA